MCYEEFKARMFDALQEYFKDREVYGYEIWKADGKRHEGYCTNPGGTIANILYLDELYSYYQNGAVDLAGCMDLVIRLSKAKAGQGNIRTCNQWMEWDLVKDKVYSMLCSMEWGNPAAESLILRNFLDMSVAYIIRETIGAGMYLAVKVDETLLRHYGIGLEQLHTKAMENLKMDGYGFFELRQYIQYLEEKKTADQGQTRQQPGGFLEGQLYLLRNESGRYGAAKILDRDFLRAYLGDMDCFILPSSIHETLFFPVRDVKMFPQEELDNMVVQVNGEQVELKERLANHSYFYDAKTGEIRICVSMNLAARGGTDSRTMI